MLVWRVVSAANSFEEVYRNSRDYLLRVAWLVCGDLDLAEDVVATVVVRCMENWQDRGVTEATAYLRRAVVNEVTDRFRRGSLERRRRDQRSGDRRGDPGLEERITERSAMVEALEALPVSQRAVLVLRYYADLSEATTAAELGIRVGTVKSRAARGLAALAGALQAIPPVDRDEDLDDAV